METRIEQALAATRFSVVGYILLAGVKWIAGIFGNDRTHPATRGSKSHGNGDAMFVGRTINGFNL